MRAVLFIAYATRWPICTAACARAAGPSMKLGIGDACPALSKSVGVSGSRAAIFALRDPGPPEPERLSSRISAVDPRFKVVALSQFEELQAGGVICCRAPPSSILRLTVQEISDAEEVSFVLDAAGTLRHVCTARGSDAVEEVLRACEQLALVPPSDAEAAAMAAAEEAAREVEEQRERQQNVLDNERRLLEVVRSRRGPAPEGLKGIKKMRWEEEERRLVEEVSQ